MLFHSAERRAKNERRSGFVILAVLLVVTLLLLAAYQYSDSMSVEARAADRVLRTTEARALADSGIWYTSAILASPDAMSSVLGNNPYDNPSAFQGRTVREIEGSRRQGRFSIVAVDYAQGSSTGNFPKRFGVTDESGKININALMQLDPSGNIARNTLMKLPNMTEDIANSILDWIDPDETLRTSGAESQYYSARTPPYNCKNGPLDSLEELLLVKGVTTELLFGTDRNRNGESDAGDDNTGQFDAGWAPYLTVYTRERNVDSEGQPRINLNDRNLSQLYSQLQTAVGQDMATYILAYRIYDGTSTSTTQQTGQSGQGGQGNQSGGQRGGGGQPMGSGAQPSSQGASSTTAVSTNISALSSQVQSAVNGFFTRPRRSISSIFGLINTRVTVQGQQGRPAVTYASPLADATKLRELLPKLLDKTTTQRQTELPGRINVNTAPDAVLRCLPGLTDTEINQVIDHRPPFDSIDSADPVYTTPAWLLTEAGLRPETAQALERYITTRTQVYRVQSVGHFDGGGPMVRLEAVIDANLGKPRILYYRDLTELGRSFDTFLQN